MFCCWKRHGFDAARAGRVLQVITRVDLFMQWLRVMHFQLLLSLAHADEQTEDVWQAAYGLYAHLVCEYGVVSVSKLAGLSAAAVRSMLDAARRYTWYAHVCLASHGWSAIDTSFGVHCRT